MPRPSSRIAEPAVFLDRDGVLIADTGYLCRPEDVVLLDGVPEALGKMKAAGYRLFVVTNQSGVARGLFGLPDVHAVHRRIQNLLHRSDGVRIDAFYICPHHPNAVAAEFRRSCRCRKPGSEMIETAASEWRLDLGASYLVGDRASDIESGFHAGVRSIQVASREHSRRSDHAMAFCEDLPAAATVILGHP